jgi:hypothetical protein
MSDLVETPYGTWTLQEWLAWVSQEARKKSLALELAKRDVEPYFVVTHTTSDGWMVGMVDEPTYRYGRFATILNVSLGTYYHLCFIHAPKWEPQ